MTAISLTVGQRILLVLALLMLLWYVVGTWYSRRRGIRTLNWLREGLAILGGRSHASWIGSAASGARLLIDKAEPPFRQLDVTFMLESRELLPLWLVNLLRGKRDEIIIKAILRSPPQGVIEVSPTGSRLEKSLRQNTQVNWRWQEGLHGLNIAYRGRQGEDLRAAVVPFLQSYGPSLHRLSWKKDKPHLLLHARLAGVVDRSPADFFTALVAVLAHSSDLGQKT
jgi:hypothetical protein